MCCRRSPRRRAAAVGAGRWRLAAAGTKAVLVGLRRRAVPDTPRSREGARALAGATGVGAVVAEAAQPALSEPCLCRFGRSAPVRRHCAVGRYRAGAGRGGTLASPVGRPPPWHGRFPRHTPSPTPRTRTAHTQRRRGGGYKSGAPGTQRKRAEGKAGGGGSRARGKGGLHGQDGGRETALGGGRARRSRRARGRKRSAAAVAATAAPACVCNPRAGAISPEGQRGRALARVCAQRGLRGRAASPHQRRGARDLVLTCVGGSACRGDWRRGG